MPTVTRASGITVNAPDNISIDNRRPAALDRTMRGAPTGAAIDDVLAAAVSGEVEISDVFEINAGAGAAGGVQRRGPGVAGGAISISVPLEPERGAVVLRQEGTVFSWHLPSAVGAAAPTGGPARRGVASASTFATFDIPVPTPAMAGPAAERGIGGWAGKAVASVITFAVPTAIDLVVNHMERTRRTGLVQITGTGTADWIKVDDPKSIVVRAAAEPRILLLIHGTNSSTTGGFGALTATDAGRALLTQALARYDAVLAFDHRTLSVDPRQNATDLLAALRAIPFPGVPVFDTLMHSRGGLVYRSLVEEVLPGDGWNGRFDRAIFVGAANSGTELANPENWNRMANLVTNLAASTSRALSIVAPGSAIASEVLDGIISGVMAFVKTVVAKGLNANEIPGLAAMMPGGPFVATLNQAQPGQPTAAAAQDYAITSNFEPKLRAPDREFPSELLTFLGDQGVDQLLGADNDLVVDIASMERIDPDQGGGFIKASLDYGPNGTVHHLNYFIQPETATAVARWLGIEEPAAVPVLATAGPSPSVPPVESSGLSGAVNRNIVVVPGAMAATAVSDLVRRQAPDYIVVERGPDQRYAFTPAEVAAHMANADPIAESLGLHESDASPSVGVTGRVSFPRIAAASPSARRGVMLAGAEAVGVVPAASEVTPVIATIPEPAPAPPEGVSASGAATAVTIQAQACMDPSVELNETATITVTISREAIAAAAGAVAGGAASLDENKKLIVMVQPKINLAAAGDVSCTIDVPKPGESQDLYFDVTGTALGPGMVWIVLRQSTQALITLRLQPTIVAAKPAAAGPALTASAEPSVPATPAPTINQLIISEMTNDNKTRYHYTLQIPGLPILSADSPELQVSKADYVAGLYADIAGFWSADAVTKEAFDNDLRSKGQSLFEDLFPPTMQQALWTHRAAVKSIQVVADEPFIPWEIVHLCEPGKPLGAESLFLGELGMTRWLSNLDFNPTRELVIRPNKAFTLAPTYGGVPGWALPKAQTEAQWVRDTLGATELSEPQYQSLFALLHAPETFDLLHYAGHGQAAVGSSTNDSIVLGIENVQGQYVAQPRFTSEQVKANAQLSTPDSAHRPIVVFNACEAGRPGTELTTMGGFPSAFLRRGAGLFVSSLWSIGDDVAATFVRTFYERLIAKDSVSEAVIAARKAARESGEPTWLAYTVYADPEARLTIG